MFVRGDYVRVARAGKSPWIKGMSSLIGLYGEVLASDEISAWVCLYENDEKWFIPQECLEHEQRPIMVEKEE